MLAALAITLYCVPFLLSVHRQLGPVHEGYEVPCCFCSRVTVRLAGRMSVPKQFGQVILIMVAFDLVRVSTYNIYIYMYMYHH